MTQIFGCDILGNIMPPGVSSGAPLSWNGQQIMPFYGSGSQTTALDWFGSVRGSILYRGEYCWEILIPGASGKVLTSKGSGFDPVYQIVSGSGGGATWGTITGTLSDQSDLQSALNAKEISANRNAVSGYAGLDGNSKLTGSQQVYGTATNTACVGNDARLSDARTPLSHTHPFSEITSTPTTVSGYGIVNAVSTGFLLNTTAPLGGGGDFSANRTLTVANATTTAVGVVELATSGEVAANVVVQGNDPRLNDARTPIAHTHTSGDLPDLDGITPPNASVNFNGQQALSFRVENRTGDPVSPEVGRLWLRTDL